MSRAWGHTIRPLTDEELAEHRHHREASRARWGDRYDEAYLCTIKKCPEEPTHMTRYWYITGRAGRRTYSDRKMCKSHAERFLARAEEEKTKTAHE